MLSCWLLSICKVRTWSDSPRPGQHLVRQQFSDSDTTAQSVTTIRAKDGAVVLCNATLLRFGKQFTQLELALNNTQSLCGRMSHEVLSGNLFGCRRSHGQKEHPPFWGGNSCGVCLECDIDFHHMREFAEEASFGCCHPDHMSRVRK
jgi:hypothetical protein